MPFASQWPSDEELHEKIAQSLGGDQKALAELFETLLVLFRYQARAACVLFGIHLQEVDDLVQEVALHFLDDTRGYVWRLAKWHDAQESPFLHYAARVCRNKLYERCARESRRSIHLFNERLDDRVLGQIRFDDSWIIADMVQRCLRDLSDAYREILWARYVLGYTSRELAEINGSTARAVDSLTERAKCRFRQMFVERLGGQ